MEIVWTIIFILFGVAAGALIALLNRRWDAVIRSREDYDEDVDGKMTKKERQAFEARKEAEAKLTRMPFRDVVKERPGRFAVCLFLGVVAPVSLVLRYGVDASTCLLLAFLLILTLISFIDLDTQEIPFSLNVAVFGLGLISVVIAPDLSTKDRLLGVLFLLIIGVIDWVMIDLIDVPEKHWTLLMFGQAVMAFLPGLLINILAKPADFVSDRIIGMICISSLLILLNAIVWAMRGLYAFGFGDIKLMIAAGALLGWKATVSGFFMGAIVGGVISVILLIRKKKGGKEHIPFGPSLCIGLYLAILFGVQLIDWYIEILKRSMGKA